jgi:hypothetical protein
MIRRTAWLVALIAGCGVAGAVAFAPLTAAARHHSSPRMVFSPAAEDSVANQFENNPAPGTYCPTPIRSGVREPERRDSAIVESRAGGGLFLGGSSPTPDADSAQCTGTSSQPSLLRVRRLPIR